MYNVVGGCQTMDVSPVPVVTVVNVTVLNSPIYKAYSNNLQ